MRSARDRLVQRVRGAWRLGLRMSVATVLALALGSCSLDGGDSVEIFYLGESPYILTSGALGGPDKGTTEGPAYTQPTEVMLSPSTITSADATSRGTIDVSTAKDGYVTVAIVNDQQIKLQVTCDENVYTYEIPGDGTPVTCPLNMGDGLYTLSILQKTSGGNYVELSTTSVDVKLEDEFYPYLRPSMVVRYGSNSDCIVLANELASGAQNEGDVVEAICNYVIANVRYDADMARQITNAHEYLPNPDTTLNTGRGTSFDYAALATAMLRSQGIPTRMVTGYVMPDEIYHSWISVHINGAWRNVQFTVEPNRWNLMDLTLAADDLGAVAGEGKHYTELFTY